VNYLYIDTFFIQYHIFPYITFALSLTLGRRDYRGGDFRDRFDRRRSPHRRHSPDRDSRDHRPFHDRRPISQERGKECRPNLKSN
jgi:hypothetical protein